MFEIVRHDIAIEFTKRFRTAVTISLVVIAIGIVSILVRGPRYGIDFAGGTLVHLRFQEALPIADLRGALDGVASGDFTVQDFGTTKGEFLIRMPEADPELKKGLSQQVTDSLGSAFGDSKPFEVLRVESVGPRVGEDLRQRGILAVVAATVMMALYIAFRFELRFAAGAALALIHDVLVTFGAISLAGVELDLSIVAALLTVVGYSVNDTVIISDRIRENMNARKRETFEAILNRSINETLSRTLMTTITALLVILSLFFFGGAVIHGFAFTLLVGFVAGTYSSIFIAAPTVLYLGTPRVSRTSTPRREKPLQV